MKEQYRLLTDLHQLEHVLSICKLNSETNSGAWQNGITQKMRCSSPITDYQWKGENQLVKPLKRITSGPLPPKNTMQAMSRNSEWKSIWQKQKEGKNVQPSSSTIDFNLIWQTKKTQHISSKRRKPQYNTNNLYFRQFHCDHKSDMQQ